MHKLVMSVDSGKYNTQGIVKLSNGNYKQVIFRTLVTNNSTGLDPIGKTFKVDIVDKQYLVGEQGETINYDISKSDDNHIIATYTGITQLLPEKDGLSVKLAYGCPVSIYKDKSQREIYKSKLIKDNINLAVNDVNYSFNISELLLLPEGCGVVFCHREIFDRRRVAVIDIGGLNMNFTIYDNLSHELSSMFTENHGSYAITNDIIRTFNTRYGKAFSQKDAEHILRNGYLQHNGKVDEQSVKLVQDIIDQYIEQVKQYMLQYNNYLETLDVVVTGGTAQLIKDSINKHIPHAHIPKDSQWTNAKGFYFVGERKFAE
jgi:plasmid segregation protein ParM